jgi:hypothetical protein
VASELIIGKQKGCMTSLKNMSWLQIVYISLLAWFLPSCFLLAQLHANGLSPGQSIAMLPLMYGVIPAGLATNLFHQSWITASTSVLFSLALPAAFVFLMLRFSNRRGIILVSGLILFCALTAVALFALKA